MKKLHYIYFIFFSLLLLSACAKEESVSDVLYAPNLPDQVYDYADVDLSMHQNFDFFGNISNEAATLGRVLFYDTKLSATNRISCGSCHIQEAGFSDRTQFSTGFNNQITPRNSMAISNLAFMSNFFWDTRIDNLKDLVLMPVQNHIEMGMEDIDVLVAKLNAVDYYPDLFESAYGSSEITSEGVSFAVAEFLRSMVSFSAKYDQGVNNDFSNFTPMELLGKSVFIDKAGCANCHNEPTFDSRWGHPTANIGLDENYADQGLGAGLFSGPSGNNNENGSNGRFKIPSLRNIALTAPYMHDGRFNTLEEVVDHYNEGIKNHPNLDWRLRDFEISNDFEPTGNGTPRRLQLDELEKMALVAFLNTLTDDNYIHDPKFSDPYN